MQTFKARHACGHVAERWCDEEKSAYHASRYWQGQLCPACWRVERATKTIVYTVNEDGRELSRWPTLKAALAEAERQRARWAGPTGHIKVLDLVLEDKRPVRSQEERDRNYKSLVELFG